MPEFTGSDLRVPVFERAVECQWIVLSEEREHRLSAERDRAVLEQA